MKIAIICPDFQKSNIRKMPWKYIYEIAKYLGKKHEIVIITDSNKQDIEKMNIKSIKKLFSPMKGETEELLDILYQENPDKCIMLLGLTSFLRREFKINKPVIGIFTSPIYSIKELIKNIGMKDSLKYRKYTAIHYLNALIPNLFVKKWTKKFDKIIFLSKYTQKKMISKGLCKSNSVLIPVGIDKSFLNWPEIENVENVRKRINPYNLPIVMYFTSPLTIRGTDILVKAFSKVRKEIPSKLIFLSRRDYEELHKEEIILKEIAAKKGISNSIEIISKDLTPKEIKEYISASDIICLPFKIVISDIPVSILEGMALNKPVISTNVACVTEMLNGNGLIVNTNDSEDLANSIIELINNKSLFNKISYQSREYMENYPDWTFVGENIKKILKV
ncbi:MAG: glycosyltransferase family 4 protein [Methanobacteriaceae archaeon]|nr:glycosyltransferase family 4 protein [Methanobacteriaceae archaeon]